MNSRCFVKAGLVILAVLLAGALSAPGIVIASEQGNVCINHYQPGAVCTANDVRVVEVDVTNITKACDNPAAPGLGFATATIFMHIAAANSPDRYDIGIFVGEDGGNAKTGTCFHDYLPPPLTTVRPTLDNDGDIFPDYGPANPFWDGDGDTCGDIPTNTEAHREVTVNFKCQDTDGDGFIDIPICTSWDNNTNTACTSVAGAFPGTKSKCDCEAVNTDLELPGGTASITVHKDPPTQSVTSGDNVSFTIDVINSGNVPLSNIQLADAQCDTLSAPVKTGGNQDNILDVGETWTYMCTVNNVTEPFTNTATATGTPPEGPNVMDQASASVTLPPTDVPTMNEWGMIFFMLLAGALSVYYLRRQRRI